MHPCNHGRVSGHWSPSQCVPADRISAWGEWGGIGIPPVLQRKITRVGSQHEWDTGPIKRSGKQVLIFDDSQRR